MFSWMIFIAFIHYGKCSGYFEIQILSMTNSHGEVSDGSCCGARAETSIYRACVGDCNTYFRVCLKQYQAQVTFTDKCTFGNITLPLLGGNVFKYLENATTSTRTFPFHFSWTRSYTIIVSAWDRRWSKAGDRQIERTSHSGIILPGKSWHTLSYNGPTANIVYRIRVMCDDHYYNTTCSKFCRPHNDILGHYTCNGNGDKVCMDGWLGTECDMAICKTGCHALHGSCGRPGECRCSFGWHGELCDQCVTYPGCKHGSCNNSPWTCNCHLNWGGILCDKDLNMCRLKPCNNHGLCMNTAPDDYTCACTHGYKGSKCELVEEPCSSFPCANGGSCLSVSLGFICRCSPGWMGEKCDLDVDECASGPCKHGGTCKDGINSYTCICPTGWQGPHCQLGSDECDGQPCVNAQTCRDLVGDYHCQCQQGWTGKNCDVNIEDCQGQCENGAQCIDMIDDFYCLCLPGYGGKTCNVEIHACDSNPCYNGATCVDHLPSYTCTCATGYIGQNCQIDTDPCIPNPCEQEGTCYILEDDYFCSCPESYTGKTCGEKKFATVNNVDSCTISRASNDSVGGVQLVSSAICGQHALCISQPGGAFDCSCAAGFTGEFCEENIEDCWRSPCQNEGTCIDLINTYQCICQDGWEGDLCNIDKNECVANPCRNNGDCIDLVTGYMCQCRDGWKGKSCTLRDGQCDLFTCNNGGTCVDLVDTFACRCQTGWQGITCHLPTVRGCDSSPCENNGTCVNSGDIFTCICKEGFEGRTCQTNVNDCNPFPCYNGGLCIDKINRFSCECPKGFAGPDCRVNIDECTSNPCTYGSTCLDAIGEYICVCPEGRTGDQCEKVKGRPPTPQSCKVDRRTYHHNTSWEYDCELCTCTDGIVSCKQLPCGPKKCGITVSMSSQSSQMIQCSANETCVLETSGTCFSPPCLAMGECRHKDEITVSDTALAIDVLCGVNGENLNRHCAKITLAFDISKLPAGVTVESICASIQKLVKHHQEGNATIVNIKCTIDPQRSEAIQIIMATVRQSSNEAYTALINNVDVVALVISHRQTTSMALSAVIQVIVETSSFDHNMNKDPVYLVPVVCSMMGILGLVALSAIIIWHRRQMHEIERWKKADNFAKGKTNNENIDNIHNLRRYRNPLYETEKVVGSGNNMGMDVGECDKIYPDLESDGTDTSPTCLLRHGDLLGGANDWLSHVPQKTKIKDINIELQKSRYRSCRNDRVQIYPQIEIDDNEIQI